MSFLSGRGWGLAYVVLAAHHLPEEHFRKALRLFKSRVTDCQRRGDMRSGLYIEVLETKVSTHANLIVAGTPKVLKAIRKLTMSEAFAKLDDPETGTAFVRVRTVYDVDHLVSYLAKEATAWAARKTGKRYQRHPTKAVGDRVRLGQALGEAMTAAGALHPYQRTYATPNAAKVSGRAKTKPSSKAATTIPTGETSMSAKRPDPTAAERQRRRRARLRAGRDSVTVTRDAMRDSVTPRDVTHPILPPDDEAEWPAQRYWATDDIDDSDDVVMAFAKAACAMKEHKTTATILDFQEARNRRWRGRWPPGADKPEVRYHDVRTGRRVA